MARRTAVPWGCERIATAAEYGSHRESSCSSLKVTWWQSVEQATTTADNETVVTEQRELDRFGFQLEHNETAHQTYELVPTMTGENIRIVWLLYPDDVPDEPSIESTENHVHLWVNVSEADE